METEIILDMDRIQCIAATLNRIIENTAFTGARISFTENEFKILPMADPIKIVLKN